ncbi:MAG: outer membrane protein assembly factor BamA [Planctomycetota bacterium]|nr:MAG: outer membrane protein assembly factor BamA [Planctomycetota bacterium]
MRESYVIAFISVVFSLCVVRGLFAQPKARYEIGSIHVEGNVGVSTAEVLSRVRSRVGQLFDPAVADEDAKRIAKLYAVDYSYYNTTVVDGKIRLIFVVVERNIIRSIGFIGNREYKVKTLLRRLTFKLGDYLDPILAETCRRTLVGFYQKKGFAFVQVELDAEQLGKRNVVYRIDEGPRVEIKSVKFSGNIAIKTVALKKTVKTEENRWFVLPAYYIEEKVSADVAKLQKAYYHKGFLDARITVRRDFSQEKSEVRITFVIDEGPAYTIEQIGITGNEQLKEEQLRALLKSRQGQIYSQRVAESDVKRLLELYFEGGFIDAEVGQAIRFISKGSVEVEFEVAEGERFRIGRVNITGNEQTQDKVIRRVLDEYDFQPGQWYNCDIARGDGSGELEKRVQRMVLAESATITPSGEVPGQRDAEIAIVEGRTGMVMVGAGVGSDTGLIGQMIFEQRNFDINDWPESFGEFITGQAFRGAGQSLRIALQPGTEVSEYLVSFREPYFQNKPISLDVIGSSWERWRESFDEERTKAYVALEQRYKNHWSRSIGIRVENVDVSDLDTDAPKEIIDVKGGNALWGVRVGAGRDLTDDIFNPSMGYNFNAGYEQVFGDHTFGILSAVHRWYKVVYEDLADRKTVLGTKLLLATTVGDAPPFEKFYAGGMGLYGIRGFDYRGVSTRGMQTSTPNPKRKDPIGSDWVFLAGAEVTVPLVSDNFAALFFIDSGAIETGPLRVGLGAGIQILIPQWFGPVPMRFELATPLMKDDDDDTENFSFSVGRLF